MGTIAHAYGSGEQAAQKGLFSNLVTLSRVDGHVDEAEAAMLERVALRLSLTPEQAQEIIKHPEDYPMVPPVKLEERYERLIQFVKMAFADGVVDDSELRLINRYAIGLGFSEEDGMEYSNIILALMKEGKDKEAIMASLTK